MRLWLTLTTSRKDKEELRAVLNAIKLNAVDIKDEEVDLEEVYTSVRHDKPLVNVRLVTTGGLFFFFFFGG